MGRPHGDVERRQLERLSQKVEAWFAAGHLVFRASRRPSIRDSVWDELIARGRAVGMFAWIRDHEVFIVREPRTWPCLDAGETLGETQRVVVGP